MGIDTKGKLLDVAQQMMLARGFAATSVDEICQKAKLTKGCFFHYFKSKEELARELLRRFCASVKERTEEEMRPIEPDPLERVYQRIDFAIQMSKERHRVKGCLLGTFAQELSESHPKMRLLCAQAFEEWALGFKGDLDLAKARHVPRASWKTRSLAEHFIAVLEGSQILAKAKEDAQIVEESLEHFRRYVKWLFE